MWILFQEHYGLYLLCLGYLCLPMVVSRALWTLASRPCEQFLSLPSMSAECVILDLVIHTRTTLSTAFLGLSTGCVGKPHRT